MRRRRLSTNQNFATNSVRTTSSQRSSLPMRSCDQIASSLNELFWKTMTTRILWHSSITSFWLRARISRGSLEGQDTTTLTQRAKATSTVWGPVSGLCCGRQPIENLKDNIHRCEKARFFWRERQLRRKYAQMAPSQPAHMFAAAVSESHSSSSGEEVWLSPSSLASRRSMPNHRPCRARDIFPNFVHFLNQSSQLALDVLEIWFASRGFNGTVHCSATPAIPKLACAEETTE